MGGGVSGEEGGGREEVQLAGLLSRWTGGAAPSQSVLTGWNQMEGGVVMVAGRGIKVVMSPSKVFFFSSISRPISPP